MVASVVASAEGSRKAPVGLITTSTERIADWRTGPPTAACRFLRRKDCRRASRSSVARPSVEPAQQRLKAQVRGQSASIGLVFVGWGIEAQVVGHIAAEQKGVLQNHTKGAGAGWQSATGGCSGCHEQGSAPVAALQAAGAGGSQVVLPAPVGPTKAHMLTQARSGKLRSLRIDHRAVGKRDVVEITSPALERSRPEWTAARACVGTRPRSLISIGSSRSRDPLDGRETALDLGEGVSANCRADQTAAGEQGLKVVRVAQTPSPPW